jgi:hypothetical protein
MDTLQLVTFSPGGRPIVVDDFQDGVNTLLVQRSLSFTPGQKAQQMSQRQRRYGGAQQVGETTDNGQVAWQWLVKGTTADQAAQQIETVLAQAEQAPGGSERYLKFKPQGSSFPTYFEVRGTGVWTPTYDYFQFAGAPGMVVQVQWPTAPLPEWDRLDVGDPFDVNSIGDYTFDAQTSADVLITGGSLTAAANLAVEKRAFHAARGYLTFDSQCTIKVTPGTTIASFKAGRMPKRVAANSYVEVYVTDNGVNSILNIDVVIAGARTNRATTNLAARIATGTVFWVRGRIEGNVVTAEYFTVAGFPNGPTPMGTPTLTNTYTLAAGAEQNTLGATVGGQEGWVWIPQSANATLDDYTDEPYTYRNRTLPLYLPLGGTIPGDAPAKACLSVTPSGGAAAPIWALAAWAARPGAPLATAVAPFGIVEAETAGDLTSWAVTADAAMSGGSSLKDVAASSAKAYTASYLIDPATMVPDDFTAHELSLEVWAAVIMSSTLVTPTLKLSLRPEDGLTFGAERFSDEWGSAGKVLTVPSSGTVRRLVRLGSVQLYCDPNRPRRWKLWIAGALGAGSSGTFGLDVLFLDPAKQIACSPSSIANDGTFPAFVASTAETTKTIRSDLSGLVAKPPANGHPDIGLGGELLETLPPGNTDMLLKLSSLVPDDPTVDATSEQVSHTATVHVAVTPRSSMLRGA